MSKLRQTQDRGTVQGVVPLITTEDGKAVIKYPYSGSTSKFSSLAELLLFTIRMPLINEFLFEEDGLTFKITKNEL